jgi:AcrR family transcriptional regulator
MGAPLPQECRRDKHEVVASTKRPTSTTKRGSASPPRKASRGAPRAKKRDEYHHGDLRRALLDQAVAMLTVDGRADFSLRDLARRLGVSHGAPSHHFADKGALLDAIAAEGFRGLADALLAAKALDASPTERLAASGVAYVRFAVTHPAHVRVMFGKAPSDAPSDECLAESLRAYKALLDLATDAVGPGATEDEVRRAVLVAWTSVHGLALLWLEGEGPVRSMAGGTEEGLVAMAREVTDMLSKAISRQRR